VLLGNITIGSAESGGAPRIGARTILGAGVRVLGDIEIGENCAVGANAVVLASIPAGKVAVGIPARVVKDNRPISQ
jgi:serine O-acetyltransferase